MNKQITLDNKYYSCVNYPEWNEQKTPVVAFSKYFTF